MRKFILALVALIGMGVSFAVATNYQMTQGTGTTFGSLVVGLVNYPQMLFCDPTTPTQCASVSTGGAISVSQPNSTATGNITTTQSVTLTPSPGQSSVGIQVTGTWTGTLFVEGSVDGTNYSQTTIVPVLSGSIQTATITANGIWQANTGGLASFRVRGNSVASGTAVVTLIGSTGTSTVMADNPFPVTGYTGMTALNIVGNTAIGSATTDKPVMMGGSSTGASGGNAQVAKVDSNGTQFIDCSSAGNTLCGIISSAPTLGSASGGLSTSNQSALSNTAVAVDASAGQLYVLYCYNPNASVAYVQLFDVAQGSVTVGTTAPGKGSYGIPPSTSSGQTISLVGKQFSTAITAAATTTPTGGVAPSSALNCVFDYK